jgi:hypothetical protein
MKETDLKYGWTAFLPIVIAISIALMPMPQGLSPHAWYYFAIFAGLIAALVVEPLPSPAVALITVTRGECALDSGQFQAAVLTGCWAWRSSYCAGLR